MWLWAEIVFIFVVKQAPQICEISNFIHDWCGDQVTITGLRQAAPSPNWRYGLWRKGSKGADFQSFIWDTVPDVHVHYDD